MPDNHSPSNPSYWGNEGISILSAVRLGQPADRLFRVLSPSVEHSLGYIESAVRQGHPLVKLVVGEMGSGKTTLNKLFTQTAADAGAKIVGINLPYLPSVRELNIVSDMITPTQLLTACIEKIREQVTAGNTSIGAAISDAFQSHRICTAYQAIATYYSKVAKGAIAEDEALTPEWLAQRLSEAIAVWLQGGRVGGLKDFVLQVAGHSQAFGNIAMSDAGAIFTGSLRLYRLLNVYPAWMLDEFESVGGLNVTKQQNHLGMYRDMVDMIYSVSWGTLMMFSTPDGVEVIRRYPALYDRLQGASDFLITSPTWETKQFSEWDSDALVSVFRSLYINAAGQGDYVANRVINNLAELDGGSFKAFASEIAEADTVLPRLRLKEFVFAIDRLAQGVDAFHAGLQTIPADEPSSQDDLSESLSEKGAATASLHSARQPDEPAPAYDQSYFRADDDVGDDTPLGNSPEPAHDDPVEVPDLQSELVELFASFGDIEDSVGSAASAKDSTKMLDAFLSDYDYPLSPLGKSFLTPSQAKDLQLPKLASQRLSKISKLHYVPRFNGSLGVALESLQCIKDISEPGLMASYISFCRDKGHVLVSAMHASSAVVLAQSGLSFVRSEEDERYSELYETVFSVARWGKPSKEIPLLYEGRLLPDAPIADFQCDVLAFSSAPSNDHPEAARKFLKVRINPFQSMNDLRHFIYSVSLSDGFVLSDQLVDRMTGTLQARCYAHSVERVIDPAVVLKGIPLNAFLALPPPRKSTRVQPAPSPSNPSHDDAPLLGNRDLGDGTPTTGYLESRQPSPSVTPGETLIDDDDFKGFSLDGLDHDADGPMEPKEDDPEEIKLTGFIFAPRLTCSADEALLRLGRTKKPTDTSRMAACISRCRDSGMTLKEILAKPAAKVLPPHYVIDYALDYRYLDLKALLRGIPKDRIGSPFKPLLHNGMLLPGAPTTSNHLDVIFMRSVPNPEYDKAALLKKDQEVRLAALKEKLDKQLITKEQYTKASKEKKVKLPNKLLWEEVNVRIDPFLSLGQLRHFIYCVSINAGFILGDRLVDQLVMELMKERMGHEPVTSRNGIAFVRNDGLMRLWSRETYYADKVVSDDAEYAEYISELDGDGQAAEAQLM